MYHVDLDIDGFKADFIFLSIFYCLIATNAFVCKLPTTFVLTAIFLITVNGMLNLL